MNRLLLNKERKLCASPLSRWFLLFGSMVMLPGYPILCGAFFVTLGIYRSFENAGETQDILYSVLLPVSRRDLVRGKFLLCLWTESWGFLIMAAGTLLRMTLLRDASVYRANVMMNANPFALGMALVIFGLFDFVFLYGYFRTGYDHGKPFLCSTVLVFFVIAASETLHHLPGFGSVNSFGFENAGMQGLLFLSGLAVFFALALTAYRLSCRRFERVDL